MRVKTCPNCDSVEISVDSTIWWGDNIYYCKKCGYRSKVFPVIDVDMKKIAKGNTLVRAKSKKIKSKKTLSSRKKRKE